METFSLIGPFFRMNTLELMQGVERFFPEQFKVEKEKEVLDAFRSRMATSIRGVKELILTLLKSSPQNRERVLDWFNVTVTR